MELAVWKRFLVCDYTSVITVNQKTTTVHIFVEALGGMITFNEKLPRRKGFINFYLGSNRLIPDKVDLKLR